MSDSAQQDEPNETPDPWWSSLWGRYQRWAESLSLNWPTALKRSDVKESSTRLNRFRIKTGGAPEVREKIEATLSALEAKRGPTEEGVLILGVQEWAEIGRHIAALDSKLFLRLLAAAKEQRDKVLALIESPFFDHEDKPR